MFPTSATVFFIFPGQSWGKGGVLSWAPPAVSREPWLDVSDRHSTLSPADDSVVKRLAMQEGRPTGRPEFIASETHMKAS